MVRTGSGKLLCVYNECVSHVNRNHSRIALRESADDGLTWSEKRYIDQETHHGDQWNSLRLNVVNDRLMLVCDRIAGDERSDSTELWIWESTDDGLTWSEGRKTGIFGYCSDKVRRLRDGTLLLLVSAYRSDPGCSAVYAHRSTDGGKSWSSRITVAEDPRYNLIEPAVLETSDGTLVAFLRENSFLDEDCMRAFSDDGGLTWQGVYPIPISCCHRPVPGYLPDGRILLTHRAFFGRESKITAAALFDESTALSLSPSAESIRLFLLDSDRSEHPDGGYTAWTERKDGSVLAVNYITDDAPKPYIRGYIIPSDQFYREN